MNNVIGSYILEGANTVEDAVITGTSPSGKRLLAEGTLQDMDKENRNRRIYAKADISPEVNGPRMTELIRARQFYGECGHPLSEDLVRQQTIDPKLACVSYEKIWIEGNLIKGQFMGTNTTYGESFDQDLRDGRKPAFSLRALGSIENINGKAYVKGIKIITWDYVIYPSHKAAYTSKIVSESAIDGTIISENTVVVPEDDPGTIITLKHSDAMAALNRMQRESANLTTMLETFDGIYDKVSLLNENTLMLTSRYGDKFTVNLERHVSNLVMDYAFKM